MWIKQTHVRQNGGVKIYYQLMKTVYTKTGSKQLLVANLGRAERVDLALAKRLAASITDEPYLFLPDELIQLLAPKHYGETFLLNKLFETTSLRRFSEDRATFWAFLHSRQMLSLPCLPIILFRSVKSSLLTS